MTFDNFIILFALFVTWSVLLFMPDKVNVFLNWYYKAFKKLEFPLNGIQSFYARPALIRVFGLVWFLIFVWVSYVMFMGVKN